MPARRINPHLHHLPQENQLSMSRHVNGAGKTASQGSLRVSPRPFSSSVRKALFERKECKGINNNPKCRKTTMTVHGWCPECKKKKGWGFANFTFSRDEKETDKS